MSLTRGPAGALVALCLAIGPAPVAAQSVNCVELYNRLLEIYRTAPLSPEYSQLLMAYNASCLAGGSAAAPVYPGYDPYYQSYYQSYYQPYYQSILSAVLSVILSAVLSVILSAILSVVLQLPV